MLHAVSEAAGNEFPLLGPLFRMVVGVTTVARGVGGQRTFLIR